jgi:hypothetical protein
LAIFFSTFRVGCDFEAAFPPVRVLPFEACMGKYGLALQN